ncbi:MAG: GFA family protein [Opitutales bacterium]
MTDKNQPIKGGCLCGSVRYRLKETPLQTTLCHCEDCRKASGAPAVAWTFCKTGTLEWTQGTPKVVRFAERERSFCGECGTPLMFFDPSIPDLFEVSTNSLDDPSAFPPVDQCWLDDALPWFETMHALPRYALTAPLPDHE